jgi:hypothetical protein
MFPPSTTDVLLSANIASLKVLLKCVVKRASFYFLYGKVKKPQKQ